MVKRVLWITNVPVGDAAKVFGLEESFFGGWLTGLLDGLYGNGSYEISFAFPSRAIKRLARGKDREGRKYYSFPAGSVVGKPNSTVVTELEKILIDVDPALVHVFGSELPHAELVMRLCKQRGIPTVLQLQGLMGSIGQHDRAWLPDRITRKGTVVERVLRRTMSDRHRLYQVAGKREERALSYANHVVGRTTYDRAWVKRLNPSAIYHHADESLRESFSEGVWRVETCDRYSLMLNQPSIPYKGAHIAIEALHLISKQFPKAHLIMVGKNPIGGTDPLSRLRRTTYGRHLRQLIRGYGLETRITFAGPLDEVAIHRQFLKSHVFLSCSSIENSSNSVSEAQALGVPVVSSYVGGVMDLVEHGKTGFLYQGDAPYMLAHFVTALLSDDDLARDLGARARVVARARHDRSGNADRILRIYRELT